MVFEAASGIGYAVQRYGPEGFSVNGTLYPHAIVLAPDMVAPFSGDMTLDALAPLLAVTPALEFIIFGTGQGLVPLLPVLKQALRARGISSDVMATGAACRTYAAMHSEGRRVGAVLLPVA